MQSQTINEFLAWQQPVTRDIIANGVLPEGQVMLLFGLAGVWKSMLAIDLAYKISVGGIWLKYRVNRHRVLLINSEISKSSWQDRWIDYIQQQSRNSNNGVVNSNLRLTTDMELRLDTMAGIGNLVQHIKDHKIDVIVADPLYAATTGDLTKTADTSTLINNCKIACAQTGTAIVPIHHSHQPTFDPRTGGFVARKEYSMFGMSFLTNWPDTILEVKSVTGTGFPNSISIVPHKSRLAKWKPTGGVFWFDRIGMKFNYIGENSNDYESRSEEGIP